MVSPIHAAQTWQPRPGASGTHDKPAEIAFTPLTGAAEVDDEGFQAFGADGFTLADAVDIINPLHHLPVIGPLYRELTGDEIDPFSRVAGGTLFFGPIGTAVSSANVALEEFTGRDMGAHVIAMFQDDEPAPEGVQIASAGTTRLPGDAIAARQSADSADSQGVDPVTAWAMSELTHRAQEAEKRGLSLPEQPYSQLLAEASAVLKVAASVLSAEKETPPAEQADASPDQMANTLSHRPEIALQSALLSLSENNAASRAPQATPARHKKTADAYRASTQRQTSAQIAAPGEMPKPRKQQATPSSGAIAEQGGWFSASMLEALNKYQTASQAKPSGQAATEQSEKPALH